MEIWFYHLQRQSLKAALPALIEKSLARGWRVVVQARSEEKIAALDLHLWTFSEDSFIAHGRAADGDPEMQPVYLTVGDENPNGARLRVLIEGVAVAGALAHGPYERALLVFDGADEDDLAGARAQWKELKALGFETSYWGQNDAGRWEKKA